MNCIKLNGFVFELELNPKVYKTVENLFKGNTTTRAWRWTQIRNVGEKSLDHFICTRKTAQKTTTSLNPSALHTQVLVFWPIKKVIFLPAAVQAGQTQNRSHEQTHSQFIQDPDMKPFVFLTLCLFGLKT